MSQGGLFIATDFGKDERGTTADRHDVCSSPSWLGHAGSWLRRCATSLKVAGSIPDGVTENFH